MRPRFRDFFVAVVLAGLWTLSPIVAQAQTDSPQAPDAAPVTSAPETYSTPSYANTQAVPAQPFPANNGGTFSTAQQSSGYGAVPAMPTPTVNQPSSGYGATTPPATTTPQSAPSALAPTNTMRANYVGVPAYTTVVPLGNVSRPSYVTARSLSSISPAGNYYGKPSYATAVPRSYAAKPSYVTAQPLSSISPAGKYYGQPSYMTAVPRGSVAQPSSASIQRRGSLGQLQTGNTQHGSVMFMPGAYPPGYSVPNGPSVIFLPGTYPPGYSVPMGPSMIRVGAQR